MGSVFTCCGQREELLDFDALASLDAELPATVQQLRKDNKTEIEHSYELRQKGCIYRGGLDNNHLRSGYGELYREGIAYLGDFDKGKPHGYGVLIKDKEQYYRGEFQTGKYHGKGRQFSLQHEFQGEYESGQRRRGTLRTAEFEYQGQFSNNIFQGHGHLQFATGQSYDGNFQAGKYHGRGFLTFPNGNKYEGPFEQGRYHGEGKFTWADNISAFCQFEQGVRKEREVIQQKRFAKGSRQSLQGRKTKEREWFDFVEIPKVIRGDGMLFL